ncbi:MAG: hypothetical protein AB8B69_07980 [Chitinophagales bacterium]
MYNLVIVILSFCFFIFSGCGNTSKCTDGVENTAERGFDFDDIYRKGDVHKLINMNNLSAMIKACREKNYSLVETLYFKNKNDSYIDLCFKHYVLLEELGCGWEIVQLEKLLPLSDSIEVQQYLEERGDVDVYSKNAHVITKAFFNSNLIRQEKFIDSEYYILLYHKLKVCEDYMLTIEDKPMIIEAMDSCIDSLKCLYTWHSNMIYFPETCKGL